MAIRPMSRSSENAAIGAEMLMNSSSPLQIQPLEAVGDLELPHAQAERAHEGHLHVGVVERGRLRGVELQPVHELPAADVTIQDQLGVGQREPGRVGGRRVRVPCDASPPS